jgi:chromosome segregation ATPase
MGWTSSFEDRLERLVRDLESLKAGQRGHFAPEWDRAARQGTWLVNARALLDEIREIGQLVGDPQVDLAVALLLERRALVSANNERTELRRQAAGTVDWRERLTAEADSRRTAERDRDAKAEDYRKCTSELDRVENERDAANRQRTAFRAERDDAVAKRQDLEARLDRISKALEALLPDEPRGRRPSRPEEAIATVGLYMQRLTAERHRATEELQDARSTVDGLRNEVAESQRRFDDTFNRDPASAYDAHPPPASGSRKRKPGRGR